MILTHLFPELARWLTEPHRALVVMPTPRSKSEQGDTELFEAGAALSRGPCALVTYDRAIVRMLRATTDAQGFPRALLGDHGGFVVTHILRLGGCYIPGQGVPLAVLVGGAGTVERPVRVLRCVRGEPKTPRTPARGKVYQDILASWDRPGETEWSRTVDVPRADVTQVVELCGGEVRRG